MTGKPEDPKRLQLVSLTEERKARADTEGDEFLTGLSRRLWARAEKAETAGDLELAIEMKAAVAAVDAAELFETALVAMNVAREEWAKLKSLKK